MSSFKFFKEYETLPKGNFYDLMDDDVEVYDRVELNRVCEVAHSYLMSLDDEPYIGMFLSIIFRLFKTKTGTYSDYFIKSKVEDAIQFWYIHEFVEERNSNLSADIEAELASFIIDHLDWEEY